MRLSACLAGVLLTMMLGVAHADDTADAKARFASGMKHYDLAEYKEALADFREAYRLRDDPVFLYNIAQCYRLLNQNADAITFYRNYLRRLPNARNRAEVEAKIATLKEAIETQEKASKMPPNHALPNESAETPATATPPPPVAPPPTTTASAPPATEAVTASPPPKKPVYKQWWLWTAVGAVVVAGVAVGVGVGLGTQHSSSAFPLVTF